MKRLILAGFLAAVGLVFTACSNFSFQHPIGVPTITYPNVDDYSTSSDDNGYTISFTLTTYTLPGSPGGTISFRLQSGELLPGSAMRVKACPSTSTEICGPFSNQYVISFTTQPAKGVLVIAAYSAVADNGNTLEITLPRPLRIY